MPGLAFRHFREIDFNSAAAAAGRFAGRTGQTRPRPCPEFRQRHRREQFETRLEQKLLFKRIANLHRGPIFFRLLSQLARCKRRACQTVASRFSADVKNRIADSAGRAARELIVPQHAETKNIYQRIALEAFVEINLAADRRHADAVSVMRDAGDDAGEKRD